MKKQKLQNYYIRQITNFSKYFDRVLKSQKVSDIHKLRLSIKRIRTLLSLFGSEEIDPLNRRELLDLLSGLFKKAGVVRESQLSLKMISRRRLVYILPFREHLEVINQKAVRELLQEMMEFNHKQFLEVTAILFMQMKSMSIDKINKKMSIYVFGKLNRIVDLKSNNMDDQKLHKIRTQIKKAGEVLSLQGKQKRGESKNELKKSFKILDNLIGKWHDSQILIETVRLFSAQNENRKVRSYLKRVVRQFEKKNAAAQIQISKILDSRMSVLRN